MQPMTKEIHLKSREAVIKKQTKKNLNKVKTLEFLLPNLINMRV